MANAQLTGMFGIDLETAARLGWVVASIQNDWGTVFADATPTHKRDFDRISRRRCCPSAGTRWELAASARVACSSPTGPAFEGAQIQSGQFLISVRAEHMPDYEPFQPEGK